VPVVFVHGGLVDYRRWNEQLEQFSRTYKVVSYSRRYNYPNHNTRIDPAYSAAVDAEDLAAFIKRLGLGPVHVVGESYGAYGVLFFAVRHPELVRTLTLAEAPMMGWLDVSVEGKAAHADFQKRLWEPVGLAFKRGDNEAVLALVVSYFLDGAKVADVPEELLSQVRANLAEWQALAASTDAFPSLRREEVAAIRAPTLLMQGEKTLPLHRILDAQYAALLPDRQLVTIEKAGHEMWEEQPVACREKTLHFLAP
jgi:non-heme chloroperoxidase